MGKSRAGIDGVEFEFVLSGVDAGKRLASQPLKNVNGREFGRIEIKEGKASVGICLPKFIRKDNVSPFSIADMPLLGTVRNDLKFALDALSVNTSECWIKSAECNITQKTIGTSTPDQALNLIHRSYTDTTNQVYEGPSKRCKYLKERETLIIRVKNYYMIKCYNKSLQQRNEGNADIEDGILRIELVMQDRIIRRLFGKKISIFEVLQEHNLKKVIAEYERIFSEDLMRKHIEPCLKGITALLVESLMETGKPAKTIYKYKEIIVDAELLRNAIKRWHELWHEQDHSRQGLYRLKEYNLPVGVIRTIQAFLDSCR